MNIMNFNNAFTMNIINYLSVLEKSSAGWDLNQIDKQLKINSPNLWLILLIFDSVKRVYATRVPADFL